MKKNFFLFVSFKRLSSSMRFMALLLVLILQPLMAHAISLPWSCDFEGGSLAPCGLSFEQNSDGTSAAAAHTGTYGYRDNICSGVSCSTGGFYTGEITNAGTDVWLRYYARYQAGLSWSGTPSFQKLWYLHSSASNYLILNLWGDHGFNAEMPSYDAQLNGWGWNDIMGGAVADGLWHLYEFHLGTSGIFEVWIDNAHHQSVNFTWPSGVTFSGLNEFFVNAMTIANGGNLDIDDMAMSNTGRIGPLGSSRAPDPPTNVR